MPRVQANKSMTSETFGTCDHCSVQFPYALIHNGFNDSAYAYCDSCGTVGFISAWQSDIPKEANFRAQGPISPETAKLLAPCSCGGRFRLMAAPRCPSCHTELDAQGAAIWIERQALGTSKGWQWQRSWSGLYALMIGKQSTLLQWSKDEQA